jgi:hypothetical protein
MQALVDSDVFKADKKTVCTQKVLNKIWENRTNMAVVEDLANLLRYLLATIPLCNNAASL